MTTRKKLTVRLDDDAAEGLERICEILDVSATAFFQACAVVAAEQFKVNRWKHPSRWNGKWRDSTHILAGYARTEAIARAIDNARKTRRGLRVIDGGKSATPAAQPAVQRTPGRSAQRSG